MEGENSLLLLPTNQQVSLSPQLLVHLHPLQTSSSSSINHHHHHHNILASSSSSFPPSPASSSTSTLSTSSSPPSSLLLFHQHHDSPTSHSSQHQQASQLISLPLGGLHSSPTSPPVATSTIFGHPQNDQAAYHFQPLLLPLSPPLSVSLNLNQTSSPSNDQQQQEQQLHQGRLNNIHSLASSLPTQQPPADSLLRSSGSMSSDSSIFSFSEYLTDDLTTFDSGHLTPSPNSGSPLGVTGNRFLEQQDNGQLFSLVTHPVANNGIRSSSSESGSTTSGDENSHNMLTSRTFESSIIENFVPTSEQVDMG